MVQGAPPPGRAGHVLVFDPLRGRVFLAGGIRNEEGRRGWPAAVREWTGERWRDVTPTTGESPVGGVRAAGVFDREHRTVLLYGGEQISFRSNETWEWDADPDLRPALHMDLDLDFAGFALAELTSVVVTATAGGRGHTTNLVPNDDGIAIGDPLPGVDLLAWDAWRGAWVRLESNAADVEAPAPLLWESEGVAEARRLLLQRDLELHLALAPAHRSGNGPEEASVAVDHLEARIRYRWPVDEPD